MKKNVIKINLPAPSSNLIAIVQDYVDTVEFDADKKRWLDEFHNNEINSTLHHYVSPEFLTEPIQKEFQQFFPGHKISGMIGLMKNETDTPGCAPPHCDRSRGVGLNYFISLGGTNVETVFYDREEAIVGVATNILYSELSPIETVVAEQSWYCYNVSRAHSVENIQSTRLFMAIRLVRSELTSDLDFEYNMDDFLRDYPYLIA
jgi:hypothetical protein